MGGAPDRLLEIDIVPTGAANLASVRAALHRLGAPTRLTSEPERIREAAAVVLPGVGAFGPAARMLRETGLGDALRERIATGKRTLCICLGMQLLARESEESPGEIGLGVIDARVECFDPSSVKVPQLGWNRIEPQPGCELLEPGEVYFANSFRLRQPPPGWSVAIADYDGPFVAALERGGVLACQFHPELSGSYGATLLRRWARAAVEASPC
ncbi:MAG: imidazole glycerol phosphate synthase subunit HisH [Phycisphaerales bacterium]